MFNMLSVILIWIYILFTTYFAGLFAITVVRRAGIIDASYKPDALAGILAGLTCVTVYAQVWSLFGGVGLTASLCLIVFVIVVALLAAKGKFDHGDGSFDQHDRGDGSFDQSADTGDHQSTTAQIDQKNRPRDHVFAVVAVIIFLFMAYGSSHGIMHYDTALYHAQAIHWIERFGSVPGLACLHTRLGYNSSAFVLNALYDFSFTGRSFHVTSGFCALILAWECISVPISRSRGAGLLDEVFSPAGMTRLAAIYYLLIIYDEMVSPASDYYMVCLAFVLVIRWLDLSAAKGRKPIDGLTGGRAPLSDEQVLSARILLSFLACFILTVKLSGALFVLLAFLPGLMIVRSREFSRLVKCLSAGTLIIVPYLIRNVRLSGWLLYPSTALGIFNVDWRVPREAADYDYKEIQVYGRGFADVSRYDEPVSKWFMDWFHTLSGTDRILMLLACVGAVVFMVYYIVGVVRSCQKTGRGAKDSSLSNGFDPSEQFVGVVLCLCLAFWLTTSPLMRYGCLYVYLVDAFVWGGLLSVASGKHAWLLLTSLMGIGVIAGYKTGALGKEIVQEYRGDDWIVQQDYVNNATFSYEIDGETFYAPVEGDRTGYEPFPSTPWDMSDTVELRGGSYKEGFRYK